MTEKENIWEEDLEFGAKGEEALKDKLNQILFTCQVERVQYNSENLFTADLQRKGINGVAEFRKARWDVKLRENWTYRFKDIAIETISKKETGKLGWFYYAEADWIIYVWADEHKVWIIDGYFIFIQKPELRNWFDENKDYYLGRTNPKLRNVKTKVEKTGEVWHTENIAVPISDFPENTIMRFDPNVRLDKQQKTFDEVLRTLIKKVEKRKII